MRVVTGWRPHDEFFVGGNSIATVSYLGAPLAKKDAEEVPVAAIGVTQV